MSISRDKFIYATVGTIGLLNVQSANAVTSIPEFQGLQCRMKTIVLNTFTPALHEDCIDFFTGAFPGFEARKDKKGKGGARTTVISFGRDDEQVPNDFVSGGR